MEINFFDTKNKEWISVLNADSIKIFIKGREFVVNNKINTIGITKIYDVHKDNISIELISENTIEVG